MRTAIHSSCKSICCKDLHEKKARPIDVKSYGLRTYVLSDGIYRAKLSILPRPFISIWKFFTVAPPIGKRVVISDVVLLFHHAFTNGTYWHPASNNASQFRQFLFHHLKRESLIDKASGHDCRSGLTHKAQSLHINFEKLETVDRPRVSIVT